jgi:hypothetical protein
MTKPKPGAKRGRPPKPKPPKSSRGTGRPKLPLRLHSRRYALACFDALYFIQGGERMVATTVIRLEDRDLAQQRRRPELHKAVERLRKMARRKVSATQIEWREAIGDAIRNTIFAAAVGKEFWIDPERVIVERAAVVGEAAWARRVLLPLTKLELTKATPDTETVHRLTPSPEKSDDERNDGLVRDFVMYWVRQLQQSPNALLSSDPVSSLNDEIKTLAKQLSSDDVSSPNDEIRKIAGIIARIFNPGPNVARIIAKKNRHPD